MPQGKGGGINQKLGINGYIRDFPGGSVVKNLPVKAETTCTAGDLGSIPGLGRSLGEWNGNPLQSSCLRNSIDRGAQRATVHAASKSWTQLSGQTTFTAIIYEVDKQQGPTVQHGEIYFISYNKSTTENNLRKNTHMYDYN